MKTEEKKAQHTKGPWELTETIRRSIVANGGESHYQQVAHNSYAAMGLLHDGSDEANANAHLIAAAPELLEALKEMVNIWEGPRERAALRFGMAVQTARAAIAKAEGR